MLCFFRLFIHISQKSSISLLLKIINAFRKFSDLSTYVFDDDDDDTLRKKLKMKKSAHWTSNELLGEDGLRNAVVLTQCRVLGLWSPPFP